MHNFRGFRKTLVPLRATNFLVGENSTGKSSFLSLYFALNQAQFALNSEFVMSPGQGMNSFTDLMSAWPSDSKTFKVGFVDTLKKNSRFELNCSIYEFADRDDTPTLETYTRITTADGLTQVSFGRGIVRYYSGAFANVFASEREALAVFQKAIDATYTLKQIPAKLMRDLPKGPQLVFILPILKGIANPSERSDGGFSLEVPRTKTVTWIAPIRSKPKRIYEGINVGYSPEGEHVPTLLRKSLRSRSSSSRFIKRLSEFGAASGLFETLIAHSFGRDNKNPFEVLVKFPGAELNISNVGYGVSQVLPLIVEFLAPEKSRTFAIQQPEVHLHPRAQAALGGLIHELSQDGKHDFFIETHSDFLIDRFRLNRKNERAPRSAQVLFFNRTLTGNRVQALPIADKGQYPIVQPKDFRNFFVKENIKLLSL